VKRVIISLSLIILVGLARLQAHAFLDHAEPAVGSKVKQKPHEVRIWFTEPIQPALSSIKVFDVTEKQVDKKDMHSEGGNKALLQVSLPSLAPGTYKTIWRVVSVDGHSTTGHFTFRVIP
jgi:copper resistance protein C